MNDVFILTVKYCHSPAFRGHRNSLHVPEEPDEPEDVSIYEITDDQGKQIDLSENSLERIEEHILKSLIE